MATIPFEYACKLEAGVVMNPNEQQRIGYVTALNGFGLPQPLEADLQVNLAFNRDTPPDYKALTYTKSTNTSPFSTATVVGVIEKFKWAGGAGDAIEIEFFASQHNAGQIK